MSTSGDNVLVEKGIDQCDSQLSDESQQVSCVKKNDHNQMQTSLSGVEKKSVISDKQTVQVDTKIDVKTHSGSHTKKEHSHETKKAERNTSSSSHKSSSTTSDGKHHQHSSTTDAGRHAKQRSSSGQSDSGQVKEPSVIVPADDKKRKHSENESKKTSESLSRSSLEVKRVRMQALVDDRAKRGVLSPSKESTQGEASSSGSSLKDPSTLTTSSFPANVHPDLLLAKQLAYDPAGLVFTKKPVKDAECDEYFGYDFSLNGRNIKFRVAKTTPTKNGQFVTFWKRIGKGPIMPYDFKDSVDLFVVCVREGNRFGQFVFPKKVLVLEDVVSTGGKGGKRAIRVYPPWVKAESTQAMKTQSWQVKHFVTFTDRSQTLNIERMKKLYAM